jgi:DNA-binding NarL/FixJ family response regulator
MHTLKNPIPNGLKLMIVEDHRIIYNDLKTYFGEQGFRIVDPPAGKDIIDSYETALEAMELEMPQIAILDIELSSTRTGMDLGWLLNTQYNIPCIFLTGIAHKIDPIMAARISAAPTVSKVNKSDHNAQVLSSVLYIWSNHIRIHPHETTYKASLVHTDPRDFRIITRTDLDLQQWRINWDDVKFLSSLNATHVEGTNNHILIHLRKKHQAFLCSRVLKQEETVLPENFIRIAKDLILNMDCITPEASAGGSLSVEGYDFSFSDVYKKRNFGKYLNYMRKKMGK